MVKILFVCMGNICRSPTAEGVFRHRVRQAGLHQQIQIDSAGTHSYHIGSEPDQRSQRAARQRGIDLSDLRARQVAVRDFEQFDYILAMDNANRDYLLQHSPKQHQHKISLLLTFATGVNEDEVPDPYYGGAKGFDIVLDLVESAADGLLQYVAAKHTLKSNQ